MTETKKVSLDSKLKVKGTGTAKPPKDLGEAKAVWAKIKSCVNLCYYVGPKDLEILDKHING